MLRDMTGREGEAFSSRVLLFATTLRGTRKYWFRQQGNFIVDTIGLPTIFFTLSAADVQWPKLARLIRPDDADVRGRRNSALISNSALLTGFSTTLWLNL